MTEGAKPEGAKNFVPRLRMFAGPNGSGKSTMQAVIRPELLGYSINPDEIEKTIRQQGFLDLKPFGVETLTAEIIAFFLSSTLLKKAGLAASASNLNFSSGKLGFQNVQINSYWAAVTADFLRQKLLEKRESFTFETVMSSPDKVALLEKAQHSGYRTYLYYVATDDPIINISRVRNRVLLGGHSVPEDKIVSRYERSLDLLMEAIRYSHRAYIFDNSNHRHIWLAEITGGSLLEIRTNHIPNWFKKAVLDKIDNAESVS